MTTKEDFVMDGQKFVHELVKSFSEMLIYKQGDTWSSFKPEQNLFGYTYHSHMIPPFCPESALMLGYGRGQTAELMRKVWGQVKITAVDLIPPLGYVEYEYHQEDAYEFVKQCSSGIKTRYDYIAIDLFDGEKFPDFMFQSDFASMLKSISKKLICINTSVGDFSRLKQYYEYGFKYHRHDMIFGNIVSFWGV